MSIRIINVIVVYLETKLLFRCKQNDNYVITCSFNNASKILSLFAHTYYEKRCVATYELSFKIKKRTSRLSGEIYDYNTIKCQI